MKAPPGRSGNALRGQLQELHQKRKLPRKRPRFHTLVGRYYLAVYSLASQLTDDPREAVLLTHDAFNTTRKQLRGGHDDIALMTMLLSAVTRAGFTAT